jgi:hypothetical protein
MSFPQAGGLRQRERIAGESWWGFKTKWVSSLSLGPKHGYVVTVGVNKRIDDFYETSWDELDEILRESETDASAK